MIEDFRHRAGQMSAAMQFLGEDISSYSSAVGLLAVHSAIAWNDAVQIRLTGKRVKYEDHKRAADHIRRICGKCSIDADGVIHFEALLGSKNAFAYDETVIRDSAAQKALTHALRFETWALRILGGR